MRTVESLDIKNIDEALDFGSFVIFLIIFGFHDVFWI
jgi:hypothetical protein